MDTAQEKMLCFRNLLDNWGTRTELAGDLGVEPHKVRLWHSRDSIPPAYWRRFVTAASMRGHDITLDDLAKISEGKVNG
jgi:hypothetical protein